MFPNKDARVGTSVHCLLRPLVLSKQKIHISYDLIGFIPVDLLTKAEQA